MIEEPQDSTELPKAPAIQSSSIEVESTSSTDGRTYPVYASTVVNAAIVQSRGVAIAPPVASLWCTYSRPVTAQVLAGQNELLASDIPWVINVSARGTY
jgi:hypothetical protein